MSHSEIQIKPEKNKRCGRCFLAGLGEYKSLYLFLLFLGLQVYCTGRCHDRAARCSNGSNAKREQQQETKKTDLWRLII